MSYEVWAMRDGIMRVIATVSLRYTAGMLAQYWADKTGLSSYLVDRSLVVAKKPTWEDGIEIIPTQKEVSK